MDDEDSILPHKLQAALEHVLEQRKELTCDVADPPNSELLTANLHIFQIKGQSQQAQI